MLRLKSIKITKLFNLYDHDIDLKLDDHVTIIHGPNGVGKTAILKLLLSLLSGDIKSVVRTPFKKFSIEFDDKSVLEIQQNRQQSDLAGDTNIVSGLLLYRRWGEEALEIDLPAELFTPAAVAAKIASQIEHLKRIDDETWVDTRDDEILSAEEILDRYSGRKAPSRFYPMQRRERARFELPEWFKQIQNEINVHIIETQRLIKTIKRASSPWDGEPSAQMIATVRDDANKLKQKIDETMTTYGKEAQALDQNFPHRLLWEKRTALAVEELQSRLKDIEQKTQQLVRIGLIQESSTSGTTMPSVMDETERRAMSLYVNDTGKKLQVLDDLANKISLFIETINKKFRHKKIRIDRGIGFVAEQESGRILPLDLLSSGEQHELVVLYDLLFHVKKNTIVLIDEPELSLHVSWQKGFLEDLLQIVKTTSYDVLVATHSPYVVGERTDLMVTLSDL